MRRAERERLARLDTELAKLAAAERRALERLAEAGFRFQSLEHARQFQADVQEAARRDAARSSLFYQFTQPRGLTE